MPRIKPTINLSELKPLCQNPSQPIHALYKFLNGKKSLVGLSSLTQLKTQGFHAFGALFILLILPLLDQPSLHSFIHSSFSTLSKAKKDVYYRLKNHVGINWRKILLGMAKEFQARVRLEETEPASPKGVTAFIVDDSLLAKSGKLIEGISMVWDHAKGRSMLGFKFLALGFWDGKSLLPLDFSLHREKGKKKERPFGLSLKKIRMQFKKLRAKGSCGRTRKKELDKDKITNTIQMLKRAVSHGFKADYLLVDSWFVCEKLLVFTQSCLGIGHLIGQCKIDKRKYCYQGKEYSAKELKHRLRKNWKRARSLKMRYLQVRVEYKGLKMNLFFTRSHGHPKVRLLASTDLRLSFLKAYQIYAIRWTIEVFFKESKQLLGLGKCPSNDFDAQIADTTLAMIRYTILSYEKRIRCYQTLGGLFKEAKEQTREELLSERIWGQMVQILRELAEIFGIDIEEWMSKILTSPNLDHRIYRILMALSPENPTNKAETESLFQKVA